MVREFAALDWPSQSDNSMLNLGQIIPVEVAAVAAYGVFCRFGEQRILVLIPETSWIASFCSCDQFARAGDRLTVVVKHVDSASGKVAASIRDLHPNPWLNGSITKGAVFDAHVVRYVEKADRCGDNPGYLLEIVPGGYAMLCADGVSLKEGQTCRIAVQECNSANHSVTLRLVDDGGA